MTSSAERRVLVATFGSAGDLFPLIPVVSLLRAQGHDVRWVAPRSVGLYLRTAGFTTYAVGDGAEMRVLRDEHLDTPRFGGWASWHHLATSYIAPSLLDDAATIGRLLDAWRPDVVVATTFAAAARLAAVGRGVPLAHLSVYPVHQQRLPASSFGLPLRRLVAGATGRAVVDPLVDEVAWGVGRDTLLLHDPALLDDLPAASAAAVGFPSWDDGPTHPGDLERIERWLAAGSAPTLLVTLGSLLSLRQRAAWRAVADAIGGLDVRALFVGPQVRWDDVVGSGRDGILSVGFVPLSRVLGCVDAVVHHGGIGTTIGCLRAGRPAAVVAQGFDQPANARLVEAAGVGVDAGVTGVTPAVRRLIDDAGLARRAARLAGALVPSDVAAGRAATHILARAAG